MNADNPAADRGLDQTARAQIGVVGLAVMGSNLARNFASKGFTVAVYNRTFAKTQAMMDDFAQEGDFVPSERLEDFVASLERPRKIVMMVKAGTGTDAVIDEIVPLLEDDDILIDGGNSLFTDTIRREKAVSSTGVHFVGCGISGGEEGALNGPSIMPGGTTRSYESLGPILEKISAHVDGAPCCTHIGTDGAGHFVKMVHNGIEYADMQLIAESYDLMLRGLGMEPPEIAEVFKEWNSGDLDSFLIEITAEVLAQMDARTGHPLIHYIVDRAGMKGTGTWTVQTALTLGVPVTGIAEAVFARGLSSMADQRAQTTGLPGPSGHLEGDKHQILDNIRAALYASKLVAYAQGFDLIEAGATEYGWRIRKGDMARIWRGGCIIRARFLNRITEAYETNPNLASLLLDPYFTGEVGKAQDAWRAVVAGAAVAGIPTPGFASALSYYDGLRSERLPAALIQGQRDYFGAHTYLRTDAEGTFHTRWAQDRTEVSCD